MINLKTQSLRIRVLLVLGMLLVMAMASVDTPASVSAHGGDTTIVHLCVNDANAETLTVFPLPIGNANIDCFNPPWPLGPGWSPVDLGTWSGSGTGSMSPVNLTDNVGIGIAIPTEKLDVVGNVHATGSFIAGATTTYGDGTIDLSAGTNLNIDSDTLFVDGTSGNVGIGTTSPGGKLHVQGSFAAGSSASASGSDSVAMGIQAIANGFRAIAIGDSAVASGQEAIAIGSDMTVTGAGSVGINLGVGGGSTVSTPGVMAIMQGNVGIGITSPTEALDVVGNAHVSGSFIAGATTTYGDGTIDLSASTNLNIDSDTLFVDSTGDKVGIGTSSPTERLEVDGNITFTSSGAVIGYPTPVVGNHGTLRIQAKSNPFSGGASTGGNLELRAGDYNVSQGTLGGNVVIATGKNAFDGSGNPIIQFFAGGSSALPFSHTERMRIQGSDGNVGIGTLSPGFPLEMGSGAHVTAGGVWTDASSRAYKENIRDLTAEEAMAALHDLKPTRFNYKLDEEEYVGFIAEDVPELVANKDRKGLSPMDIVAVLTKVVQEQEQQIAALEARLAALEGTNEAR